MKHFKYRVVAGPNWEVTDAEFQRKGAQEIYHVFNDFKESVAKAKSLANATGLYMEILYKPTVQNWFYVYTVKSFMKGRLIK